jgi:hypothetical protein
MEDATSIDNSLHDDLLYTNDTNRCCAGDTLSSSDSLNSLTEDWAHVRFDGLTPDDFIDEGLVVYTAKTLAPPPHFQGVWQTISTHHRTGGEIPAQEHDLLSSSVLVLVLADINDKHQMQDVIQLGLSINRLPSETRPCVVLVQHSVPPRDRSVHDESSQFLAVERALRNGISDTIVEEPVSFKLVCSVTNRLIRRTKEAMMLSEYEDTKWELIRRQDHLEITVEDTVWDYLRVRMQTAIPILDENIPPGRPARIGKFQIGACISPGANAPIYKLQSEGTFSGEVVQMLGKHDRTNAHAIKHIRKSMEVVELVSMQSHPNIIKLNHVYHSVSHVFLQLEYGGDVTLQTRLRRRDNGTSPEHALNSDKAKAIMSQIVAAVSHLHVVMNLVHRAITTEHVIVAEAGPNMGIKLGHFDSALVAPRNPCHLLVGTYPFAAPEIALREMYDPFAIDVWSSAVVFLEVFCCSGVIDQVLPRGPIPGGNGRAQRLYVKHINTRMAEYFKQEQSLMDLLTLHAQPELQDLMLTSLPVMARMLDVNSHTRIKMEQLSKAFE